MSKSKRLLPRVLRVVVWLAIVVTLGFGVLGMFGPTIQDGEDVFAFGIKLKVENQWADYPWYLRLLVIGGPSGAMAYALFRLAGLLSCAVRSEVFSAPAAGHLRSFGLWLLIATVADLLLPLPTQLLQQLLQSAHTFTFSTEFDSEVVWKLIFSTLIMLLARVLSDAYRLAEENRQFI